MISITGHPLQAAQPIIMPDGTMAVHFRNWCWQVNQAVGETSLLSVWGNISGTLSDQTDLDTALTTIPTSSITSGTFDDARISESSVTQHEGALAITVSQITDLGDPVELDVSNEFAALTEKVTPDDADLILIEDSAAAGAKKKVQVSNLGGGGGGGATKTIQGKFLIQTLTNAVAGEFDFDSIPSGYDRLILEGEIRSDASATADVLNMYYNADTTNANYYSQIIAGSNGATAAGEGANPRAAIITAATSPANDYASVRIVIENYTGSYSKRAITTTLLRRTSTDTAASLEAHFSSITTALTRIRLRTDNHATDQLLGKMTLYGEKQVSLGGGTPVPIDNATTPYTLTIDDAYTCQRFTAASPAVTIPTNASIPYPVGTEIAIRQAGTGTLTLTTTSLTINGTVPSWAQHVEVLFRKVGTDEWDVV